MSTDFKPGDLCEIVRSPCMEPAGEKYIGLQCTVLGEYQLSALASLLVKLDARHYRVQLPNGDIGVLCGHCLRKIQPPKANDVGDIDIGRPYDAGDWEVIERVTGWSPKVRA